MYRLTSRHPEKKEIGKDRPQLMDPNKTDNWTPNPSLRHLLTQLSKLISFTRTSTKDLKYKNSDIWVFKEVGKKSTPAKKNFFFDNLLASCLGKNHIKKLNPPRILFVLLGRGRHKGVPKCLGPLQFLILY